MNRNFYMGIDASTWDAETIAYEAAELMQTGLFDVGYKTILLGSNYEEKIGVMAKLSRSCFEAGITLDATSVDDEKAASIKKVPALRIVRLNGTDDVATLKAASEKIKAANGRAKIQIEATKENSKEVIEFADLLYFATPEGRGVEYFDITRNCLDSCYDNDIELEHSDAVIRAGIVGADKRYECLPMTLHFNYYKNQAIYFNYVVLGTPLVLGTKPSELSADTIELLLDDEIISLASSSAPMGKVAHYYDPWHVLYGRALGGTRHLMCIVNRCHGDAATNITADRDFGGAPNPFSVYDLDDKRLLASACRHFEIYVETTDRPLTPSAKLLLIDESKC